jgi:hypothetical protein
MRFCSAAKPIGSVFMLILFCGIILVGLNITLTAFAGGLPFDVPANGVWVQYDVVGEAVDADGKTKNITGTITVACVGSITIDGQSCRWIEATLDVQGDFSAKDTVKVLVDEKYLLKSEEPLKHIREAWDKAVYDGKTKTQPIPLKYSSARDFINRQLGFFIGGTFDSKEKLDQKTIESKLGKFQCDGMKTIDKQVTLGDITNSSYEIWFNAASPFGVVELIEQTSNERDGKLVKQFKKTYSIAAIGTDAKTEIPDH